MLLFYWSSSNTSRKKVLLINHLQIQVQIRRYDQHSIFTVLEDINM